MSDHDAITSIWREAPFARLPNDAPPELYDYVEVVRNPCRVYAVHKAKRRHNFQLLVNSYMSQLRDGCGAAECNTPTCFTCRKRLNGKSPIRRYNSTSARTLAVYLASQDNPGKGLCPNLRRVDMDSAAVNNLIFSSPHHSSQRCSVPTCDTQTPSTARKGPPSADDSSPHPSARARSSPPLRHGTNCDCTDTVGAKRVSSSLLKASEKITVSEKPISTDYRSFAATVFGTVTFKMLEWLSPQAIRAMSQKLSELNKDEASSLKNDCDPQVTRVESQSEPQSNTNSSRSKQQATPSARSKTRSRQLASDTNQNAPSSTAVASKRTAKEVANPHLKRNSNPTIRSPPKKLSGTKPPDSHTTNAYQELVQSNKTSGRNALRPDKPYITGKNGPVIPARLPDVPSKPAFFENIPYLDSSMEQDIELRPDDQTGGSEEDDVDRLVGVHRRENIVDTRNNLTEPVSTGDLQSVLNSSLEQPMPQSLSQLNVEIINFLCDVLQEDCTTEKETAKPTQREESYPTPENHLRQFARVQQPPALYSPRMWKAFNEQSIFYVLSDPHALVQSFSSQGRLLDSHSLWYCMLRLTRVMPDLVLHSLWIAAGSLFIPPTSLKGRLRPGKYSRMGTKALTKFEASCVLSTCLHALVASAPLVSDSKTLYEMSRIRSSGLVLSGSGPTARQPTGICSEYDDAFCNDIALRLARRLFCGITARRYFDEMGDISGGKHRGGGELDVLSPLLNQLDLLNSGQNRVLKFSQTERLIHETRVPTLLLDWARAVLLREWNGEAEFSIDGPFYGALSLIATMHENRGMLLLGDIQFRVDYLSERLDPVEIPVSWTAFTSTRQRRHMLDYPYLFDSDTLVTFFRSINFSKMSRVFEESSSLRARMTTIVESGSLINNPHHKTVLQDLLRTASSKYLVLEINRENVLMDAFDQLWRRQERELLRPLKIHLGEGRGEEGFDSGGVQQEFFRMAIAECLDPKYGAFTTDERTRMAWFVPGSPVEAWKFEMIGLLVSLAVYNGLTLPVTFPRALYRKLLGQPVQELYHVADGWPELASGLTVLLEWDENDGLVEDIFARTYEFSVSSCGSTVTREMIKEDDPWPQLVQQSDVEHRVLPDATSSDEAPLVVNDNRDSYVSDYVRYLTDVSVRPQYEAFERGFRACLDPKSLSLLSPPVLQSIVEGLQDIDVGELRRCARYVGWDASHHTIKDFWSIVKRYDDRMKRKLLEFVTASDRVPVGGVRNLQFVIQKNGEEEEGGHLPTAYTCYGTLLLPEYSDKEILRERLGMALENAQGFGFA